MIVQPIFIKDCFLIQPRVFEDERGCFFESFNSLTFKEKTGLSVDFVQDNQSTSKKGVLRGLHFQQGDFQQAKLVRIVKGKALDVIVDLRDNSPTFGQHYQAILSEENQTQLFIPRGFAHGFLALTDDVVFSYKCDNFYSKESEGGIIYNDPDLKIDWMLDDLEFIISEKDQELPFFKDILPL